VRELRSGRLWAAVVLFSVWIAPAGVVAQSFEITTTGTEQTFSGLVVGLSSPTNAQATRLTYGGITGYWLSDSCGPTEEITFTFSPPVQRVEVAITASSNVGGNVEVVELDANGAPYTLVSSELDNSTPTGGVDFTITSNQLHAPADDARGTYTATASGAGAPIESFTIRNVVVSGCPNGAIFRVTAIDPQVCGNGVTEGSETCDDGGESAACDADCTAAMCGDGVTNATAGETCDDGGESAACDADCTAAMCGDGVTNTTAGETCDDGGESAACDTDCTAAMCGDGVTNATAGETCDDGDDNSDSAADACRTTCVSASCGDGVVDSEEACDDGSDNSDSEPNACRPDCVMAACGDGVLDEGEECDDGPSGSATCTVDCAAMLADGGVGHDAAAPADGGALAPSGDGGCGCRVAVPERSPHAGLGVLVALFLWRWRRRRKGRR